MDAIEGAVRREGMRILILISDSECFRYPSSFFVGHFFRVKGGQKRFFLLYPDCIAKRTKKKDVDSFSGYSGGKEEDEDSALAEAENIHYNQKEIVLLLLAVQSSEWTHELHP